MEATFMLAGSTALLGAAGGIWGLVVAAGQRKREPASKVDVQVDASDDLKMLPLKLEAAFERVIVKHQTPPPVALDLPTPDWVKEWAEDAKLANDRVVAAVKQPKPQPELESILAQLVRIGEKMDELLAAPAAQPVDEFLDLQRKLVRQIAEAVEPLTELPGQFSDVIMHLAQRAGSSVTVTSAPPLRVGNGGRSLPPAPKAPPTPRAAPPPPNMAITSVPPAYVAGSIVCPPNQPTNLLALIQQQLQPNCPGSAHELVISADESVLVGSASAIGGALTAANFAYELAPGGQPRIYRSSFPGSSCPLGDLQLFAAAAATVHVEVVV